MIKLSTHLSKKVPIPGSQFSSQQFGASLEVEVADADQPDAIRARIRQLYGLLSQAVDEQIASASKGEPAAAPSASSGGNGNGAGQAVPRQGPAGTNRIARATAAQGKAIFAICRSQGLDVKAALAEFRVADPAELNVREASRLIDSLKSRRAGSRQ